MGDVTEDGQADLAINYVDAAGFDSVAIVEGPFAARTGTFGDGSLEPLVIFRERASWTLSRWPSATWIWTARTIW